MEDTLTIDIPPIEVVSKVGTNNYLTVPQGGMITVDSAYMAALKQPAGTDSFTIYCPQVRAFDIDKSVHLRIHFTGGNTGDYSLGIDFTFDVSIMDIVPTQLPGSVSPSDAAGQLNTEGWILLSDVSNRGYYTSHHYVTTGRLAQICLELPAGTISSLDSALAFKILPVDVLGSLALTTFVLSVSLTGTPRYGVSYA
jgi:hypothetical protein